MLLDDIVSRDDALVTVTYIVICLCIIFPPIEFINAGLTVQTIYSNWLGSEQLDFINYHIRRTVATMVVHSVLPLGYFIMLGLFSSDEHAKLFNYLFTTTFPGSSTTLGTLGLTLSIVTFTFFLWFAMGWLQGNHPVIKRLAKYDPDWKHVANQINTELLRVDNFTTGNQSRRLIVTDSWIILTSTYDVKIAKKIDVKLEIKGAIDLSHHPDFSHTVQLLDIDVLNAENGEVIFPIRLTGLEFGEFKTRVAMAIENLRNIVVKQSISEQFVSVFLEQIRQNERYHLPSDHPELENCIGCMQKIANVKLIRRCVPEDDAEPLRGVNGEEACRQCYCRPMWCADCLGRWFAARCTGTETSRWLSSKCPCPTCRSVFCVLDICLISDQ